MALRPAPASRSVDDEVRRLMLAVVVVAVVLLLANLGARAYLLLRLTPEVNDLHAAARGLDRVHAATADENAAYLGYLATGSAASLAVLEHDEADVRTGMTRLAGRLPGSSLTADLVELGTARQAWAEGWGSQVVTAEQRAPRDRAALDAFVARGATAFDRYRAAHDRLASDIDAGVARAEHRQRTWLVGSGVVQAVIAAAVIGTAVAAHKRVARRITRPIALLGETVSRVARGDLDARVEVASAPEELVRLGRDIDAMAGSLGAQIELVEEQREQAVRHGEHLSTVLTAAREIAGSLSLRYVMRSVASAAQRLGSDRVRIWLLDDDGSLALSFDSDAGPRGPGRPVVLAAGTGVPGRAAHYARPTGPEPVAGSDDVAVGVPLVVGGRVVGALECAGLRFETADLEILEALAGYAAGAVASALEHERTAETAVTDALTKLANRRAFDEEFAHELGRAKRYGRPLAVVSLDLDHFKALNDRYGHAYGDLALQQAAEALRTGVRESDRVFRIGGEEMVVLCPETDADDATALAERLRVAVEAAAGPDAPRVTGSFGVAALPAHAGDGASLLLAADRALYAAKHRGRNRVEVAPDAPVPLRVRE